MAFRGSSIHLFFIALCLCTGTIIGCAVQIYFVEVHRHLLGWSDSYIELLLAVCGALVGPCIGFFDLNPHSLCHVVMHYVGVVLMLLGQWSWTVQSRWSAPSIVPLGVGAVAIVVWYGVSLYYPPDLSVFAEQRGMSEKEIFEKVHSVSWYCIVAEAVAVICCCVSCVMFLWNLKDLHSLPIVLV